MKDKIIIVDIDGTVAIHEGRRDHYEWALVPNDLPNQPVVDLVKQLIGVGHRIVYVSGRESSFRNATFAWLYDHFIALPSTELYMRPTGDYREDKIIKREIYERNIEPFYDVWFVLDDRDSVVEMWRELGLTCLQVAKGDF